MPSEEWGKDDPVADDDFGQDDPVDAAVQPVDAAVQSARAEEGHGFWSQIASLPAAYRDVVLAQLGRGDMSAFQAPGVVPVAMEALATHPTLAKVAGGIGGAMLGTPGGPAGMIMGGATGAAGMDAYSQLAQQTATLGTTTATEYPAPQTSADAASRSAWAGAEGAMSGAGTAGLLKGAPPLLRAAATPGGAAVMYGGSDLARGKSLPEAAWNGLTAAAGVKVIPGGTKLLSRAGGAAADAIEGAAGKIENFALRARLAHLIRRKAPEAAKAHAGTTSGTMPMETVPMPSTTGTARPGASTSSTGQVSYPAPASAVPEAAPSAPAAAQPAPAGVAAQAAAAPTYDPRMTAPGGWREVGIANWYGTKGGPTAADWAQMGGAKAQLAWMESRNMIPGGNTAQDVAAAVARGVSPEQIQKLYGTARQAKAAPRPDLKKEVAESAPVAHDAPMKSNARPSGTADVDDELRQMSDELREAERAGVFDTDDASGPRARERAMAQIAGKALQRSGADPVVILRDLQTATARAASRVKEIHGLQASILTRRGITDPSKQHEFYVAAQRNRAVDPEFHDLMNELETVTSFQLSQAPAIELAATRAAYERWAKQNGAGPRPDEATHDRFVRFLEQSTATPAPRLTSFNPGTLEPKSANGGRWKVFDVRDQQQGAIKTFDSREEASAYILKARTEPGSPGADWDYIENTAAAVNASPRTAAPTAAESAANQKLTEIQKARQTLANPKATKAARAKAEKVLADPQAQSLSMAEMVTQRVMNLRADGMAPEQIAQDLAKSYGFPPDAAGQMVSMVMGAIK